MRTFKLTKSDQTNPDTQSKKLFTGIILRGSIDKNLSCELKSKIKISDGAAGLESQRLDEKAKRDAMLSLFVVKPKQTGFSAMAQLTASAIKSPGGTAVLALRGESGDRDAEINLDKLIETLNESGVYATSDTDALAEYINQASTQAGEFDFIDASEPTEPVE